MSDTEGAASADPNLAPSADLVPQDLGTATGAQQRESTGAVMDDRLAQSADLLAPNALFDPGAPDASAESAQQSTTDVPPQPPFPSMIRFEAGHAEHFVAWLHDWFEWKLKTLKQDFGSDL